jgi:hypothetical protein
VPREPGSAASEATMAKRSRRAESAGQDARSECPATGTGSPEPEPKPTANPEDTQVDNLCYGAAAKGCGRSANLRPSPRKDPP